MKIEILTQYNDSKDLKSWGRKGMDIASIETLEVKYNDGKPFPKALREFLFLAGETNDISFGTHDSIDILQERAQENLEYCNQKIDRPFFAFDHLTDCEQFTFVFLDEDQDDPDVYLAYPYYVRYGRDLIVRYRKHTFSSLVNDHIYRIKNNYPME